MKIRSIMFTLTIGLGLFGLGCAAESGGDVDLTLDDSVNTQAKNGSPHFIGQATAGGLEGANLVVSFKEAGLAAGSTVTIVTTGSAVTTYECVNGGGNNPSASNKTTTSTAFNTPGTFVASKNGSLVGSLTTSPPSAASLNFSCPGGQDVVLVSVTYSNIVLTDTTNGTSVGPLPDTSYTNPAAP